MKYKKIRFLQAVLIFICALQVYGIYALHSFLIRLEYEPELYTAFFLSSARDYLTLMVFCIIGLIISFAVLEHLEHGRGEKLEGS
ncbi:MAG: hypothetical protein ACXQTV_03430 [Candidatus Hecatellaceae archaeon]